MYHTTGFELERFLDVVECVERCAAEAGELIGYPPELGLYNSLRVAIIYLRRNTRQVELAEYFECSQSTISRAVATVTPWIERTFRPNVPVAEELSPDEQYVVDGTLAPSWSWARHPELYSGKHKTTGVNLQVVCDLYGNLRYVSDPADGCRHDSAALDLSGVLDGMELKNWIGDKGYVGMEMITPIKKPICRDLLDWEKEFNKAINGIRWIVERAIANLKTWRVLHIDYRRPYKTFATTISAVLGLEFYRNNPE
jgi:DDE superfamily endonuclease